MEGLTIIPGRSLREPVEYEEFDVGQLPLTHPEPTIQTTHGEISVPRRVATFNQSITTPYGDIPVSRLVTAFAATQRHAERKREWLQTDEGKAYNRQKAKEYYERNKEKVLEKRTQQYATRKDVINERSKNYYRAHRDEIIEKNKERKTARKQLAEMGITV